MMAEDDVSAKDPSTSGLSSGDLEPRIYEGGFKTWECSVDLTNYLCKMLQEGKLVLRKEEARIIEVC